MPNKLHICALWGWTRIFLASTDNYETSTGVDYTVSSESLRNAATETMIVFVNSSNTLVGSFATFLMPANWATQSPMLYSAETETVLVSIDGSLVGSESLVYGKDNPNSYTCDGLWGNSLPSGQICITNTTAPFYTRWAVNDPDRCNSSNQNETTTDCTVETNFSILVR